MYTHFFIRDVGAIWLSECCWLWPIAVRMTNHCLCAKYLATLLNEMVVKHYFCTRCREQWVLTDTFSAACWLSSVAKGDQSHLQSFGRYCSVKIKRWCTCWDIGEVLKVNWKALFLAASGQDNDIIKIVWYWKRARERLLHHIWDIWFIYHACWMMSDTAKFLGGSSIAIITC